MNPSDDMQPDWRDALDGHESPLDVDRFWADLEPRLPKKRRRRGLLWWWLGGIGTAGILVALWLVRPDGNTVGQEPEGRPTSHSSEGEKGTGDPEIGKEADVSMGRDLVMENGADRTASERRLEVKKPQAARKAASTREKGIPVRQTIPTKRGKPVDQAGLDPWSSESGIRSAAEAATEELPPAMAAPGASETSEPLTNEPLQESADVWVLPEEQGSSSDPSAAEAMPEEKKKRKRAEWALDILGGPGISMRSMKADDGPARDHLTQRDATERPLESWSAGADLRWTAPNGWFLTGGFRWLRMNERFDWQKLEQRSEYGLADGFLLTAGGAMVPWQDSAWITWQETRTVTHYNKVESVMVPLGVGFRFPWGAFSTEGALGGSWNLQQWARGRSLDRTGLPANWNGKDELRWRTSHGLGLFARCRLAWSTGKGPSFFVQPEVHWSTGNRMDAAAGYRVRYTQGFLQAGVSLRLK